jgi:hypothetical protein
MTKNSVKIVQKMQDMIQLINESEVSLEMGTAFASFMLNPTVVWAKFILTDDKRNGNGMRIPKQEFANLIRTGIHMPVKMYPGEIAGHNDSKPLGVMTHLKEQVNDDGSTTIVALAALWENERPADVKYIKQRFADKQPVNISWEVLYGDKQFNEAEASYDLYDTVLSAATVVADPAYMGRTPVLSVAAKKWSKAYMESLPDKSFLYRDEAGNRQFPIMDDTGKVDRIRLIDVKEEVLQSELSDPVKATVLEVVQNLLARFEAGLNSDDVTAAYLEHPHQNLEEELETQLQELQAKLDKAVADAEKAQSDLAAKEQELAGKDATIAELTQKTTELETELIPLREAQAQAQAKAEREEKLANVKNKFSEAGVEKEDEFFTENAEKLISLSDDALNFMVQELKVFAEKSRTLSTSSTTRTTIPAISGNEGGEPSISDVAKYLRERKTAKK